jgi:hypothetical protein
VAIAHDDGTGGSRPGVRGRGFEAGRGGGPKT